MKKSDGKLFDKQFVHFMWDDSLEGREGFFANDIDTLKDAVNYNSSDNRGVVKKGVERYPFKFVGGLCYVFFYYDPNYEYKKAWLEGKEVQHLTTIYAKNRWEDVPPDEWYWDGCDDTQYRIKPEKEWRPFKDVQEFKNAWYDKMPFDVLNTGLEEPFVWVRWKGGREHKLITGYYNGGSQVSLCDEWISLERLFKYYEFLDGSRCGVEE